VSLAIWNHTLTPTRQVGTRFTYLFTYSLFIQKRNVRALLSKQTVLFIGGRCEVVNDTTCIMCVTVTCTGSWRN